MINNIFKNINKVFLSIFGRELKIMTTFNGIGAFSHALKLLGIEVGEQVYCETNVNANKTYIANNKFKLMSFIDDIRKLLVIVRKGEKVDILVQTPPCQSFSNQGKRAGLKSLNGNLFLTAIELQKKVDSSIVIYENVKGMLSHEKFIFTYRRANGETFETRTKIKDKKLIAQNLTLINTVEDSYASLINPVYDGSKKKSIGLTFHTIEKLLLEDTRYNYYWKIVNAADQGLPQNRERLFIIGIKKELDIGFKFPENKDLDFTVEDVLEDNVDQSNFFENDNNYYLTLSYQEKRENRIHKFGEFKDMAYNSDSRVNYPYVAPTFTTGNNNKFIIDGKIRILIPLENKRIHGFREDFKLVGSKTTQNTQLGNTVSPPVYARLLESLAKALKPVNTDTIYIKRSLVNKYAMNYLNVKEHIAEEYLEFIKDGGKVIVQIDKYDSVEDKKLQINKQTYFLEIKDLKKLGFASRKYGIRRFRITAKVTKYLFAYDPLAINRNIKTKDDFKVYTTNLFNSVGKFIYRKLSVVSLINYKAQFVRDHIKNVVQRVQHNKLTGEITSKQSNNTNYLPTKTTKAS